jgi:uncharacterized protein (TIGR00645 family)
MAGDWMADQGVSARLAKGLGRMMLATRWLMAPIYIGLLVGLFVIAVKFVQQLLILVPGAPNLSRGDAVLGVLGLVDLSLVANLVLIVILAGWQGFVDPPTGQDDDGKAGWFALDFSEVKLKVIGSVATIAAVELLESFMHADSVASTAITLQLAILLSLGVLGVLLALMDRLSHHETKE